jgi:hypothetical protein
MQYRKVDYDEILWTPAILKLDRKIIYRFYFVRVGERLLAMINDELHDKDSSIFPDGSYLYFEGMTPDIKRLVNYGWPRPNIVRSQGLAFERFPATVSTNDTSFNCHSRVNEGY